MICEMGHFECSLGMHFMNPVPLHEVYERWVRKFERQRLDLLHDLKKELEGE